MLSAHKRRDTRRVRQRRAVHEQGGHDVKVQDARLPRVQEWAKSNGTTIVSERDADAIVAGCVASVVQTTSASLLRVCVGKSYA